eukprot:TRINITY_DN33060_c0_g1_i1.p1 TRINITY_DN33060_c0_g1~~TRINITY_DN33060_c0_g1_i1.p1  ORF type:complete len:103 (+),score=1.12 TRINITY_DN33060_c0_g1_i1:1763-2071(+)
MLGLLCLCTFVIWKIIAASFFTFHFFNNSISYRITNSPEMLKNNVSASCFIWLLKFYDGKRYVPQNLGEEIFSTTVGKNVSNETFYSIYIYEIVTSLSSTFC